MRKYYRNIIFSKTPLKTQYNYKNIFQILPISDKAPKGHYADDFPLFIEYFIDYKKNEKYNILEETAIRESKEYEIINLLSVLSNHRFFKYRTNHNSWSVKTPSLDFDSLNEKEAKLYNSQESVWSLAIFMYPDLKNDLTINKFTEKKYQETKLVSPYYRYFMNNPIEDKKNEIQFPETISFCIDNYFNLSDKISLKIKSCIYLACDGIDIIGQKRSLGFLSYISAIEGLVNIETSDDEIIFKCKNCQSIKNSPYHCPNCREPIWGIKTKFVEFLKKFVAGSDESEKNYKKIYNLRSKITHESQLFTGDYELSLDKDFLAIENGDWLMRLEALQLFRISLTNWLNYPDKRKK